MTSSLRAPGPAKAPFPDPHFQDCHSKEEQKKKILNAISRSKYRLRQLNRQQVFPPDPCPPLGAGGEIPLKDAMGCPNETQSWSPSGVKPVLTGWGKGPTTWGIYPRAFMWAARSSFMVAEVKIPPFCEPHDGSQNHGFLGPQWGPGTRGDPFWGSE
jgi:hypothetical protein